MFGKLTFAYSWRPSNRVWGKNSITILAFIRSEIGMCVSKMNQKQKKAQNGWYTVFHEMEAHGVTVQYTKEQLTMILDSEVNDFFF